MQSRPFRIAIWPQNPRGFCRFFLFLASATNSLLFSPQKHPIRFRGVFHNPSCGCPPPWCSSSWGGHAMWTNNSLATFPDFFLSVARLPKKGTAFTTKNLDNTSSISCSLNTLIIVGHVPIRYTNKNAPILNTEIKIPSLYLLVFWQKTIAVINFLGQDADGST